MPVLPSYREATRRSRTSRLDRKATCGWRSFSRPRDRNAELLRLGSSVLVSTIGFRPKGTRWCFGCLGLTVRLQFALIFPTNSRGVT